METQALTLFERIGGKQGIQRLVQEFYLRVLADEELSLFFKDTPMEKLRSMQYEFFSAALDGPVEYSGRPIHHVHQGLGIKPRHLGRFLDHLFSTIKASNLSERDIHDIITRINICADEITGVSNLVD